MCSKFLRSLREENLITPEDEYEEDYIMEVSNVNKRVCYLNHRKGLNWMSMYDILISKIRVLVPFTDFQFTILEQTLTTPSQLHLNSWAMIWGFEIICQYLKGCLSPNVSSIYLPSLALVANV